MRHKTFQDFVDLAGYGSHSQASPTWEPIGEVVSNACNATLVRNGTKISPVSKGSVILDGDELSCDGSGQLSLTMADQVPFTLLPRASMRMTKSLLRDPASVGAFAKKIGNSMARALAGKASSSKSEQERMQAREKECRKQGILGEKALLECRFAKIRHDCSLPENYQVMSECMSANEIGVRN